MERKQRIKNIYFDLDGPILDVSKRYFFVHKNICKQLGIALTLNKGEYWRKKRAKEPLRRLLGFDEKDPIVNEYKEKWLQQIEETDMLMLDELFTYTTDVLETLKKRYHMTLVILRRKREAVIDEIAKFNLNKYFKNIFVVKPNKKPPHVLKYETVSSSSDFDRNALFIGDTEVDIDAARMLGIKSVAVLSGIRNEKIIKALKPDYIVQDIRGLLREIRL